MLCMDDVINIILGYVFNRTLSRVISNNERNISYSFSHYCQFEFSCMMEEGIFRGRVMQRHRATWRSSEAAAVKLRGERATVSI